jgi:hypothetical protein
MARWNGHRKPLPADRTEQQQIIEKAVSSSHADTLKKIAKEIPVLRDAVMIPFIDPSTINLDCLSKRTAALIQRRGQVAPTPCNRCANSEGPWEECVLMNGEMRGGCANCYFDALSKTNSGESLCSNVTTGIQSRLNGGA